MSGSKINKKVAMLGDFSVGKTSLVQRFVHQAFSDKYLTTVGVKVDTKLVQLAEDKAVKMVLWDIAGEKSIGPLQRQYLKGLAGYFLVVDSTRLPTLKSAKTIHEQIVAEHGELPFCLLLNKTDLDDIEVTDDQLLQHGMADWAHRRTSAKTGDHVEAAFTDLAAQFAAAAADDAQNVAD